MVRRREFIKSLAKITFAGTLTQAFPTTFGATDKKSLPATVQTQKLNTDFDSWILNNLSARSMRCYEQPDAALVALISQVYNVEEGKLMQAKEVPGLESVDAVITQDNIPLYPYWQGNPGEYVFHPMAYGNFFSRIDCAVDIEPYLNALLRTAHRLPNGGLLWYYPDVFKLSRFMGPDLSPSAIGQGRLLGGIIQYSKRCGANLQSLARQIFKGLSYQYYEGGLNLENSALLEIPLFRSAPEVVFNGWLHAIFFIRDYIIYTKDIEAEKLLYKNYSFLSKSLPRYHDHRTGLSKYSDLVPYQVRLEPGGEDYRVLYIPQQEYRNTITNSLIFNLIKYNSKSPYDNRIIKTNDAYAIAWIGCSSLYDTWIYRESKPFRLLIQTGLYSPKRATPDRGGEKIVMESMPIGPYHAVNLSTIRKKLYCGFPTNFSKWGKENYYHIYHIVALACLLAMDQGQNFTPQERQNIIFWVNKWMDAVIQHKREGFQFTSYEKLLAELKYHGACTLNITWKELLNFIKKLKV